MSFTIRGLAQTEYDDDDAGTPPKISKLKRETASTAEREHLARLDREACERQRERLQAAVRQRVQGAL